MSTSNLKNIAWKVFRLAWPLYFLSTLFELMKAHGIKGGWTRFENLPPGTFTPVDHILANQQTYRLECKKKFGPIYKSQIQKNLLINIIGLENAREFLTQHAEHLNLRAKQLQSLFPLGHIRAMQGDTHRQYRKAFVQAMRPELVLSCEADLRAIIQSGLKSAANDTKDSILSTRDIVKCTRLISTTLLMRLIYGLNASDPQFKQLVACYNNFSRDQAPAYHYGTKEREIFVEIRTIVQALVANIQSHKESSLDCVLHNLVLTGDTDETQIGNLIYMLESGRFDIYSLLRWIIKYLCENPSLESRLNLEFNSESRQKTKLSSAVVLETLRCNQSEALQRDLSIDVVFKNYFIPRGSQIRVCLWESHKDEEIFENPLQFDPDRFLGVEPSFNEFSPFGIDSHRCVAADIVVRVATLFVEELAQGFTWKLITDSPPVRGPYHWEPGREFSMRLMKR